MSFLKWKIFLLHAVNQHIYYIINSDWSDRMNQREIIFYKKSFWNQKYFQLHACDRRWIEFFTEFIIARQIWLTVCMWSSMNWIFYRIHHFCASNLIDCLRVIVDKLNFLQNSSFLRVRFDWLSACNRRWTEFFTEFIISARQIWLTVYVWSSMNWIFHRLYHLFLRVKFNWLPACDCRWIEFFTNFIVARQIWLTVCVWSSMNWIFHRIHHLFLRVKFDWLSACDRRWIEFFKKFIAARQIWLIFCMWSSIDWIFHRFRHLFLRVRFDWLSACDRRWIEFFTAFITARHIWLIFCMWSSMNWIFFRIRHCFAQKFIDCLHVIVDELNFSQNSSFIFAR